MAYESYRGAQWISHLSLGEILDKIVWVAEITLVYLRFKYNKKKSQYTLREIPLSRFVVRQYCWTLGHQSVYLKHFQKLQSLSDVLVTIPETFWAKKDGNLL